MMMIASNSSARKGGEYEELEGRRRGMLNTGDWCNPVSNTYCTMCKMG